MSYSELQGRVIPRKTIELYDIEQLRKIGGEGFEKALEAEGRRREEHWENSQGSKVLAKALRALGERDLQAKLRTGGRTIHVVGYMKVPHELKIKTVGGLKCSIHAVLVGEDVNWAGWQHQIRDDAHVLTKAEVKMLADRKQEIENELFSTWFEEERKWLSDAEVIKCSRRRGALYYEDGTEFVSDEAERVA